MTFYDDLSYGDMKMKTMRLTNAWVLSCLDKVEDDEDGEECVEVDVEGEAPLDVVDAAARRPQQILVAHRPQARRDHQP